MQLNSSQLFIYETGLDFIVDKLEQIIRLSSDEKSALDAAYFALYAALKYELKDITKLVGRFYPEPKYRAIKGVYGQISGLVSSSKQGKLIKALSAPSFFNPSTRLSELQHEVAHLLKRDLSQWLELQIKAGHVSMDTMANLEKRYAATLSHPIIFEEDSTKSHGK